MRVNMLCGSSPQPHKRSASMNDSVRSRHTIARPLGTLLLALVLSPAAALAQDDVLLIFSTDAPAENDITYINVLEGLGLSFQIASHATFTVDDAADKQLVLISESVTSSNIANKFNDVAVPV